MLLKAGVGRPQREMSLALRSSGVFLLGVSVCFLPAASGLLAQCQASPSIFQQVAEALKEGSLAKAEEALRASLRGCPRDARALGMLGVVLDGEKHYDAAEQAYTQALEIGPPTSSLLNNVGNHYLARGDVARARAAYLQAVALDRHHSNANLHLAQMSLDDQRARAAVEYLNQLPLTEQGAPPVKLLRAQALFLNGQRAAAESLLRQLEEAARKDPQLGLSVGKTLINWEKYPQAEKALTAALGQAPTDFDILYNLAVAAAQAGHLDRAREVLGIALRQRPEDVNALLAMAKVHHQQGQEDSAAALIERAQRLAPDRPDTLVLLAQITEKMGYYEDAADVYGRYLKLRPNDDVARRERGFALLRTARFDDGIQDLSEYVRKHPSDAEGLYELAVGETIQERDKAQQHLDAALQIDPRLLPARLARAVLSYQEGNYAKSVEDLKFILQTDSRNYQALDMLGEIELRNERLSEAVSSLRQAATLAPREAKILLHYSHALRRLGREAEAESVLAQFKQLGPDTQRPRPYKGLLDFLGLPSATQRARYLDALERRSEMNPGDVRLKMRLGKEELAEGEDGKALRTFHQVRLQSDDAHILADCGKSLAAYGHYEAAREFLSEALQRDPALGDARLDLSQAIYHTSGPGAGLAALDEAMPEQRQGDYYLLRAQFLEAMGKDQEAAEALNLGLAAAPSRPDLYFGSALFLIDHRQNQQALRLLQQGLRVAPDSPQLKLSEAIVYSLMDRTDLARQALLAIESGWPEWSQPYVIDGIILTAHQKFREAKPLLETAIALGAQDSIAHFNLAVAAMGLNPPDTAAAERAIEAALKLSPDDPYVQCEAGEVEYARKEYRAAFDHLLRALQVWPDMIEAHQTLSACYRALGEKDKSVAELKQVLRIKQEIRKADQPLPPAMRRLLFSLRQ